VKLQRINELSSSVIRADELETRWSSLHWEEPVLTPGAMYSLYCKNSYYFSGDCSRAVADVYWKNVFLSLSLSLSLSLFRFRPSLSLHAHRRDRDLHT